MPGKFIQAAGGIVMRGGKRALFAVVQRSKDEKWVLPRGKLKPDENPIAGGRREVIEETGHRVEVNEFLGAITYRAGGRPKVVQFWQMQAEEEASHDLMSDIVAVEWLPLKAAVRRLSYPLEKLFLRHVGRSAAAPRRGRKAPRKLAVRTPAKKTAKKAGKKTGKKTSKRSSKKASKKARKAGKARRLKNTSGKKPKILQNEPKKNNKPKDKGRKRKIKRGAQPQFLRKSRRIVAGIHAEKYNRRTAAALSFILRSAGKSEPRSQRRR